MPKASIGTDNITPAEVFTFLLKRGRVRKSVLRLPNDNRMHAIAADEGVDTPDGYFAWLEKVKKQILGKNYLASALSDRRERIEEYFQQFDPVHTADYLTLLDQAKTYMGEAREFRDRPLVVNHDIADSFLAVQSLDFLVSQTQYQLEEGKPFFNQYDSHSGTLGDSFCVFLEGILQDTSTNRSVDLGKIILGVYDFARRVNMAGPGFLGVKDSSMENYMMLKKVLYPSLPKK
jgi:hypothetical protein